VNLLIVESPTKARKISSFLGPDWRVEASFGHILDLPKNELAIDPKTYALKYEPSDSGRKTIAKLRGLAAEASQVYLATDPDREGEAISDHLRKALQLRNYRRVTFNEITKAAIIKAIANHRQIDGSMVMAQEARRVADRLIGYKISFPLSRMANMQLSAGRCQSPAVRLVVERQQAIEMFKVTDHFGACVYFDNKAWQADWMTNNFVTNDAPYVLDQALAERAAACRQFKVIKTASKTTAIGPPAPFTTSSLLQAAGATLKMPPALAQNLAQKLFEGGHITYHRTDNPNLSDDGAAMMENYAHEQGWPVSPKRRKWRLPQGAQEAHEAIRPTHPENLGAGENDNEKALYQLIWRRAIASQMVDAIIDSRALILEARSSQNELMRFIASEHTQKVAGWKIVTKGDKAADDDQDEPINDKTKLPLLQDGNTATAGTGELVGKKTAPPSRYTETSLIKTLEKLGIGRPSTFASIVKTITERGYVRVEKRLLYAQPSAIAIVNGLTTRFDFIEYKFTEELERQLDLIAQGETSFFEVVSKLDHQLVTELAVLSSSTPPAQACTLCGKPLMQLKPVAGRPPVFGCTGFRDGCTGLFINNNGVPGEVVARDKPTDAQLAFARKLAIETKIELHIEVAASSKLLREWIDKAKASQPPRMASPKQIQLIKQIMKEKSLGPPAGWPDAVTGGAASAFIEQNAANPKLNKSQKKG
jgi:DNA topoisomerase I